MRLLRGFISSIVKCMYTMAKQTYICGGIGAGCSLVVRVFAHGMMGHQIDPTW